MSSQSVATATDDTLITNQLWIFVATSLVFVMQAGFLLYEIGLVRKKNVVATAMKNCVDWSVVTLTFFFIGFGFMFGPSIGGIVGFGGLPISHVQWHQHQ